MKVLHIKSDKFLDGSTWRRQGLDIIKGTKPLQYTSCCWDFKLDDINDVIGGKIFLHHTKNKPSYVGGVVTKIEEVTLSDGTKRADRVKFTFISEAEGKGAEWIGASHSMAWNGGLVEV